MDRYCPNCDGLLEFLGGQTEAFTASEVRYRCSECQIEYRTDPTGWLTEADG